MGACWALHLQLRSVSLRLFSCNSCCAAAHAPIAVQVYHPNIDLEGNVCLNILREDWKPVLSINSVIYGLQYLFLVGVPCRASVHAWRAMLKHC